MSSLKQKMDQVTKRLDHNVPDPEMSDVENSAAASELAAISEKLANMLPDPSLSPDERLERLARVIKGRNIQQESLQTAARKVEKLKTRINELVPGDSGMENKLDKLSEMAFTQCGVEGVSCMEALERLGDPEAGIDAVKND